MSPDKVFYHYVYLKPITVTFPRGKHCQHHQQAIHWF